MAEPRDPATPTPPGLLATVSAAVAAALTLGLLFGVLDALLAGFPLLLSEGEVSFAFGCLAASVMTYSVAATIVLVLLAVGSHPLLRRYCEKKRLRRLLILGGALAIWIELSLGLTPALLPEGVAEGTAVLVSEGVVALVCGVLLARLLVRLPAGVHAALRTLAVIAIGGGLYFVQSEESDEAGHGALDERNRELFNLLFVVVDRLPVNELSCYGGVGETPNLDRLADRGVVIEACYVPSPIPPVNLAVIATGGLPRAAWWGDSLSVLVRDARRGDGGALTAGSYATAAFLHTLVPPSTEGNRGIECDAHEALIHSLASGAPTWECFRADLRWQILEDRLLRGATADSAVQHARAWLAGMGGKRFVAEVVLREASGAEAVDAAVGELLELLAEIDAEEETLVILTAAGGARPHPATPLHASALRVPLLLANTRLLPHGSRYDEIVEGEDVVPTILDLLDLGLSNETPRRAGRSFLPGILGTQRGEADTFRPKRFAFAEDDTHLSILDGKSQLIASRNLFDRDTVPADDALLTQLEASTSLRLIDLAAVADEASSPELAVVRTLWSELRRFQNTNPTRNKPGPDGFPEGSDPGRAEENNE